MICAQHNWWDAEPCPQCAPVAVTVTEPVPEDGWTIPAWLRRNKDNTFAHLETPPCLNDTVQSAGARSTIPGVTVIPDVLTDVTQDQLLAWVDDPSLNILDRQPIYRELQRRAERVKSYERIDKLKASKAAKENGGT